jgi:biotin carboxyl carrier protein
VIRVHVHEGSTVKAGEPLVVLEAMKMETPVSAPFAGRVSAVHVEEGAPVAAGTLLVELDA